MSELALLSLTSFDLTPVVWGNTFERYIYALVVFVVLSLVLKLVQYLILKRLSLLAKKTKTDFDDTLISVVKSLRPGFYYFVAFYFATKTLVFSAFIGDVVYGVLVVWVVYQVVIGSQIVIDYALRRRLGAGADPGTRAAVGYLSTFAKIGIWAMGILLLLSNFGVNITSLVAGLGIGGVAIAFALQKILGDLFSSFAIYFDKPFRVGDFIVIGASMGTVEKIGIKTTRLRALSGEELVISNTELTSARVQNFKKLKDRRVVFSFGVLYETPRETVAKIPSMVADIIQNVPKTRFDRSHFKEFGDSALVFENVYYVTSSDYADYMNAQQEINLKILEAFEKEKIEFAYPTQTVYVQK